MDLHRLRVFASVYRNRSFSKASEEVCLTQPTVSDHIKSLEDELQCRLFDRLGRSTIPTAEADLIYSNVLDLLERSEAIVELISQSKARVEGRINIGASTIPAAYLLPRFIVSFKMIYPEIVFDIAESDSRGVYEKIARQEVFMGLVGSKTEDDSITYERLMEDTLTLICPLGSDYPDEIDPGYIKRIPFILREAGSGTRKETESIFKSLRINLKEINIVSTLGSTESVKEAVKAGMGCSVLSHLAVREELKLGFIRAISIKGVSMKRGFYIAFHNKRTMPRRYELFKKHLIDNKEAVL